MSANAAVYSPVASFGRYAALLLRRAEEEDALEADRLVRAERDRDRRVEPADLLHDARVRRGGEADAVVLGRDLQAEEAERLQPVEHRRGISCSRSIFAESTLAREEAPDAVEDGVVFSRSSRWHLGVGEDRCSSAMTPWNSAFMKLCSIKVGAPSVSANGFCAGACAPPLTGQCGAGRRGRDGANFVGVAYGRGSGGACGPPVGRSTCRSS